MPKRNKMTFYLRHGACCLHIIKLPILAQTLSRAIMETSSALMTALSLPLFLPLFVCMHLSLRLIRNRPAKAFTGSWGLKKVSKGSTIPDSKDYYLPQKNKIVYLDDTCTQLSNSQLPPSQMPRFFLENVQLRGGEMDFYSVIDGEEALHYQLPCFLASLYLLDQLESRRRLVCFFFLFLVQLSL
ncbi:hypothetical protein LI328DRAFT_47383 [Trichoderma asperelloides]|nr:hypothetical protein LI328DRAFT_47383 [Trichoderma asperelloides]